MTDLPRILRADPTNTVNWAAAHRVCQIASWQEGQRRLEALLWPGWSPPIFIDDVPHPLRGATPGNSEVLAAGTARTHTHNTALEGR